METVKFALSDLGLDDEYKHLFSIDKQPSCREIIEQNVVGTEIHADVDDVDVRDLPKSNVYVAGFPCQPFSTAGQQEGAEDSHGRGLMVTHCIEYIAEYKPEGGR